MPLVHYIDKYCQYEMSHFLDEIHHSFFLKLTKMAFLWRCHVELTISNDFRANMKKCSEIYSNCKTECNKQQKKAFYTAVCISI